MIENQENKMLEILENLSKRVDDLIERQTKNELKIQELTEKLKNIYEDIYEDEEDGFEIECPYCNFDFYADIDENNEEIRCPECGNSIELDWNGNPEDEQDFGCNGGSCSHCKGCE